MLNKLEKETLVNKYLKMLYEKPIRIVKIDLYSESNKNIYAENDLDIIWERATNMWIDNKKPGEVVFYSPTRKGNHCKKVGKYSSNILLNEYSSLSDAARELKIDKSQLLRYIKGKKMYKGYEWRYI